MKKNAGKSPREIAKLLGISHITTHIFLCIGPDCCTEEAGKASWNTLKAEIKQRYPELSKARIYRSKVGCLRICQQGPIALVYPQGKWFQGVSAEKVADLLDHLEAGGSAAHPLEFKQHPLPSRT